jgi:hypothetical protein
MTLLNRGRARTFKLAHEILLVFVAASGKSKEFIITTQFAYSQISENK